MGLSPRRDVAALFPHSSTVIFDDPVGLGSGVLEGLVWVLGAGEHRLYGELECFADLPEGAEQGWAGRASV
jgi:hypothetical protein